MQATRIYVTGERLPLIVKYCKSIGIGIIQNDNKIKRMAINETLLQSSFTTYRHTHDVNGQCHLVRGHMGCGDRVTLTL